MAKRYYDRGPVRMNRDERVRSRDGYYYDREFVNGDSYDGYRDSYDGYNDGYSRRSDNYNRSGERINHEADRFNDEHRRDKDIVPAGMYQRSPSDLLSDYQSGWAARRRMEMAKDGMIVEDNRAIANLPQEVMIKPYEKVGPYLPEVLEDSIRGVDGQMDYDDEHRAAHFYPKKI